jgi:hypothetical protein
MNVKKNEETKAVRWPHTLGSFFVNAFSRIRGLFTRSKSTLHEANNSNTGNIETSCSEEPENISYDSPYMLILPPGIRNKFFRLAGARRETYPPILSHAGNHSTLALLNINNVYFWGSNNVEAALTTRDLNELRAILIYEKSLSPYSALLVTAEADAIMKAFKQRMTADCATMFIDRKQCNTCGRREFNETYLRRLLPVLRIKELTVYTTNSLGKITKLVLSPMVTNTGRQFFW